MNAREKTVLDDRVRMQVHERSRNSSQFPEPACGISQPLQWPRVSTHRRRRLTAVPRSRIFRSGLGPRPSACSYLILGSHTKRVTVIGLLVPTQGTIRIFPSTPGVVTQRRVEEGQRVRRGDLLFVLSDDRRAADAAGNARVADTQATSLAQRRESMLRTIGTLQFLRNQTQEGSRTRLQTLQDQKRSVQQEIELHGRRISTAASMLERQRTLARERFISEMALQDKEDPVETLRVQLISAERQEAELASTATSVQSEPDQSGTRTETQRVEHDVAPRLRQSGRRLPRDRKA